MMPIFNDNPEHKTFKIGETINRVPWSKKPSSRDTSEPIYHVSRRPFVKYYDKGNISYLLDISSPFEPRRQNGEIKFEST